MQSDHGHLYMKLCRIVRELIVGKEVDEECAPMYRVRFESGEEISAYPDELLDPNWEQSSSNTAGNEHD